MLTAQQRYNIKRCFMMICFSMLFAIPGYAQQDKLLTLTGKPSESLLDVVTHALHCVKPDAFTMDGQLIVECFSGKKRFEAHLYGSTSSDLNRDGHNDVILGITFPFREHTIWKEDDQDLLLMYTVEKDGTVRQVFQRKLDPGEQGGIRQLWFEDVTGDGNAEILCVHWNAYRGRFGADIKARYIIIGGHQPFTVLIDLGIGGISHYPQKNVTQADVHFQDRNGDGIQEFFFTWSEGPNNLSLVPLTSPPDIYQATFMVTEAVIDALRQAELPNEILQALHTLQTRKFFSKQMFVQTVEQQIGGEAIAQYGELIVQTAIGPYQLQQTE